MTDTWVSVTYIKKTKKKKGVGLCKELRVNLGANFLGGVEKYRLLYSSQKGSPVIYDWFVRFFCLPYLLCLLLLLGLFSLFVISARLYCFHVLLFSVTWLPRFVCSQVYIEHLPPNLSISRYLLTIATTPLKLPKKIKFSKMTDNTPAHDAPTPDAPALETPTTPAAADLVLAPPPVTAIVPLRTELS